MGGLRIRPNAPPVRQARNRRPHAVRSLQRPAYHPRRGHIRIPAQVPLEGRQAMKTYEPTARPQDDSIHSTEPRSGASDPVLITRRELVGSAAGMALPAI